MCLEDFPSNTCDLPDHIRKLSETFRGIHPSGPTKPPCRHGQGHTERGFYPPFLDKLWPSWPIIVWL